MSIFSSILGALGIGKPANTSTNSSAGAGTSQAHTPAAGVPSAHITLGTPGAHAAMPAVDVVAKLDGLAKANPQKLDWKVSIVDLLKLLNIDSSFEARKELATELGCPADLMGDSAAMNIWLHKTVLQKISENGGNVPVSLYK